MPELSIDQALQIALGHHHSGRLAEAERIYRQILAQDPAHADALHHLGMIAHRLGRLDAAAELMSRSIARCPDEARYHINFGALLSDRGKVAEAIAAYARALQIEPAFAAAHFNMGNALSQQGKLQEAAAAYLRAVQVKPDFIEAHVRLGAVYCHFGILNEGGNAFQQALRINPNYADAFTGLTFVLTNLGRDEEALAACRKAIALRPACPDDYNNLGILLHQQGKLDDAMAALSKALELRPVFLEAWNNLGNLLTELQRLDEAFAAYRRASAIDPKAADPHFNQAWVALLRGDFENGWRGHEWRWGSKNFSSTRPVLSRPEWDGGDLRGKTILLHAEQGLGDAIHFVRYASLVARRGGRVIVHCPPELARLFKSVEGIDTVATEGKLPEFDVHWPLMSLPLAFNTRLESIPAEIPYIRADAALAAEWARKLAPFAGQLRVGLAWAGRPTNKQDRKRSMTLDHFAPLAADGITFFSLQKGPAAAQAANPPPGMRVIDFTADLHDLADTAASIAHLDLVISVDTAVAHLAGAMGKPVWTLLPFKPDWRWMLGRTDSPWYPTMRLFRQSRPGDWMDVIAKVRQELASAKVL
jgi:tetratricopeptide (TPR) repeat protein